MKNTFIALFVISSFLFLGCTKDPVPDPPVVLMPKVTLTVSPQGPVSPGDVVTVSCLAINASSTTNNIGAPTTIEWSFSLKVNEALTVSVTALGEKGYIASDSKKIEVLIPYVPTRTDTLCNLYSYYNWTNWDALNEKGEILYSSNLNEEQLSGKYQYFTDGSFKLSSNGDFKFSWQWIGEKDSILWNTSQRFKYVFTKTGFQLYQSNKNGTQTSRSTYKGYKL